MKNFIIKVLIGLLIVFVIGYAVGKNYVENQKYTIVQDTTEFTIEKGDSAYGIGKKLAAEGIVGSEDVFKLYVLKNKELANFKAGLYAISPTESVESLIKRFHMGDTVVKDTVKVTFQEGLTTRQVFSLIEDKFSISGDEMLAFAYSVEKEYWFLSGNPKDSTYLDGVLFPDTYIFEPEATVKEVVRKILNHTEKKLEPVKEQMLSDKRTVRGVLTVASLVEKEALHDEDRPMISGVIQNRLAIDMLLQIDATVLAAVGHKEVVTYEDLKVDSPYNTYKHKGLPPSPIAMPGIVSVEAALSPEKHDFIFYVADRQTGYHHYAVTYAEHEENIQQYWKKD